MANPTMIHESKSSVLDSAHSWVIAIAGCVLQFIVIGSNRANGLLFVALLDYNHSTREEASWPFTMPGAAVIICAPVTGYLTTFLSVRSVTLFGTLLLSVGSAACFFSTNVYYVSVFFGIIRGAGISMCVNSIPGMINSNFHRHRATAMGIATAGDSVGSLAFPLMVHLCLDQYRLKGTFLLLGGMSLHAALGAMLLVPHPGTKAKKNHPVKRDSTISIEPELSTEPIAGEFNDNQEIGLDIPGETEVTGPPLLGGDIREHPEIELSSDNADSCVGRTTPDSSNNIDKKLVEQYAEHEKIQNEYIEQVEPLIKEPEVKLIMAPKLQTKKVKFDRQILKNIFTSRGFYLTVVAQVADMFIISNYNLVIVDYVADKGVEYHQGLFMLTVFAVGQLVGRLALGWLTDRKYLSRPIFLFWALNLCAGLTVLLTFLVEYGVLLLCGTLLGMIGGTLLPVTNVLYSDYLRKQDVDLAVAFSISIKGLIYMTRIPMIGYFRDQQGSYDQFFYIMAAMLSSAAFVWLFEGIRLRSSRTTQKIKE